MQYKYISGGKKKEASFHQSLALHCWHRVGPVSLDLVLKGRGNQWFWIPSQQRWGAWLKDNHWPLAGRGAFKAVVHILFWGLSFTSYLGVKRVVLQVIYIGVYFCDKLFTVISYAVKQGNTGNTLCLEGYIPPLFSSNPLLGDWECICIVMRGEIYC